jgi:hypothetical protein
MDKILNLYNHGLELIPVTYRLPLAVLILVFLVFSLVSFFKKNLFWIVIFLILLPAAWPSLKQIGLSLVTLIQKIPK